MERIWRSQVSEQKRVAVFARRPPAGNPLSVDLQRVQCEQWAEDRGMDVVKSYEALGGHDVYLDLLGDVGRGEFDAVVASEPPRYGRRSAQLTTLVQVAQKAGVSVHVVSGGDTDLASAAGSSTLELMAAAETQWENEHSVDQ